MHEPTWRHPVVRIFVMEAGRIVGKAVLDLVYLGALGPVRWTARTPSACGTGGFRRKSVYEKFWSGP